MKAYVYETFVQCTIVYNDNTNVEELESLLLVQEARIERKHADLDSAPGK